MSILIKGMKKSQNCFTCPFKFLNANVFVGCRLPKNCPLVEVPTPHGRLINADRLKRQVEGRSWKARDKFIELIDNAPTIIEAEEGEEA